MQPAKVKPKLQSGIMINVILSSKSAPVWRIDSALHLVQDIFTPICSSLLRCSRLAWTFDHRAQHCPQQWMSELQLQCGWTHCGTRNIYFIQIESLILLLLENMQIIPSKSCKNWNGHDPAALGQRCNLAPFTSFLRSEVTKLDWACPCAHRCWPHHNLHQTWLRATRDVKRVISHE